MKTIIINASPRKNQNTAALLRSAAEGAVQSGAETEWADLYDLEFTGCRSCLICKRRGREKCRCYLKDGLSPLLDKIYAADTLLIGTPVYFGQPVSRYFALMERLHFPALSYDDHQNYFKGKVNVGLFLTMNVPKGLYEKMYRERFEGYAEELKFLNGTVYLYPCCDTLQVSDYSRYDMRSFNEEAKKKAHETQFPLDLKNAFEIGKKLSSLCE